jgi:hypothetical protein
MSLPAEALATMCTGVDSTGATARELTDRMVMADGRGKSCKMGNSRARDHGETCAIAARRSARCPVDQRPNVLRLPGMRRLGTDSSARRGCRRSGRTNGRPVSATGGPGRSRTRRSVRPERKPSEPRPHAPDADGVAWRWCGRAGARARMDSQPLSWYTFVAGGTRSRVGTTCRPMRRASR